MDTAVDWLEMELRELYSTKDKRSLSLHLDLIDEAFKNAKEIEKGQIMDSFYIGSVCNYDGSYPAEQYYNETFKSE